MSGFDELLAEFEPMLRAIAAGYFLPGAEMDDVMQEARIALWMASLSYDQARAPGGSFRGYACVLIHRRLASAVRRVQAQSQRVLTESRRDAWVSSDAETGEAIRHTVGEWIGQTRAADNDPVTAAAETRQQRRALVRVIRVGLSEFEREVLEQRAAGASYGDIAAEHGRSWKAVGSGLARARRKLRDATEEAA